jgi:Fic family protein
MKYKGISETLSKEIEIRIEQFDEVDTPVKIVKCRNLRRKAIETNSQIHSYRIEHPQSGVPFCVPRNNAKREIKRGIGNIERAFEWGQKNLNPDDFKEEIVRGIAYRITPELYEGEDIASYRTSGTAIRGAKITPPYPQKLIQYEIPWFEDSIREQLKCPKTRNHIETAIFAHLHLARMHPFVDGNGRTARTFQDAILDYFGIPLPVIEAGERMTYYKLLDNAVEGWSNRSGRTIKGELSEQEKMFYDFIAGKINISLDRILNSCSH